MATIGKWNGHKFIVNHHEVKSFTNLTVTASCETEDKKADSEKYVARKNAKPIEVGLTVVMDARIADYGGNVQSEALALCDDVYEGKEEYLYMGKSKMFVSKMMGVSAKVSNIQVGTNGEWVHAEIALTLKQSQKKDGTTISKGNNGRGRGTGTGTGTGLPATINPDKAAAVEAAVADTIAKGAAARTFKDKYGIDVVGTGTGTGSNPNMKPADTPTPNTPSKISKVTKPRK